MDFLFTRGRNPFVFMDPEATKVGAIFDRDMEHGEALEAFDEKMLGGGHIETTEDVSNHRAQRSEQMV